MKGLSPELIRVIARDPIIKCKLWVSIKDFKCMLDYTDLWKGAIDLSEKILLKQLIINKKTNVYIKDIISYAIERHAKPNIIDMLLGYDPWIFIAKTTYCIKNNNLNVLKKILSISNNLSYVLPKLILTTVRHSKPDILTWLIQELYNIDKADLENKLKYLKLHILWPLEQALQDITYRDAIICNNILIEHKIL